MSYSNTTPNYKLPIFSPEDKPSWLGAWNTAMTNIDTGMYNGVSATDLIKEDVNTLKTSMSTAEGNIEDIQEDIENIQTQIQGVKSVSHYPVISGAQATIVPTTDDVSGGFVRKGVSNYEGGFVRLGFTNAISDTNVHVVNVSFSINGKNQGYDLYCVKKTAESDALSTKPVFVPPNADFYLAISIDNTAPEVSNVTLSAYPYSTLAVPVVTGGN